MKLSQVGDAVLVRCPAKVNLFLEVLGRRPDGYHEIDTVMQAVTLYDDLLLRREGDGGIRLRCSDPRLPSGPENLVCRAAQRLLRQAGASDGVSIELTKRIPVGAGLGGGSSDAAGVLAGLDALLGLGLGRDRLEGLAAGLGSDVPFFLRGGTARCQGRGEQVTPVANRVAAHFVVCWPPCGLSTAEVYAAVDRLDLTSGKRSASVILAPLAAGDFGAARSGLFNRLEEAAIPLCPEMARAREALSGLEPGAALVSGSGSGAYAFCGSAAGAAELARKARDHEVGSVFVAEAEQPGGGDSPPGLE